MSAGLTLLAFGAMFALSRLIRNYSWHPWLAALRNTVVGPRTDVRNMTRRELLETGCAFVTWTLSALVVWQALMLLFDADRIEGADGLIQQCVLFSVVLFGLMAAAGAFYVFARALFRSRFYISRRRIWRELAKISFAENRSELRTIEKHYRAFAARNLGHTRAEELAAIDLQPYDQELHRVLRESLTCAGADSRAAVVIEIAPAADWRSRVCVMRLTSADDDSTVLSDLRGPALAGIGRVGRELGGAPGIAALYLLVRCACGLLGNLWLAPNRHVPIGISIDLGAGWIWLRPPEA